MGRGAARRSISYALLLIVAGGWSGCRCRLGGEDTGGDGGGNKGGVAIALANETLAAKQDKPKRIAVDGSHVYWTNWGEGMSDDRSKNGAVKRVAKSGGAPEDFAPAQSHPRGLALDATNAYWANDGDGTVMKLAKTGGTPAIVATIPKAWLVAVDGSGVYVSTRDGKFHAVPASGGTPKLLADTNTTVADLVLDESNVYWVDWRGSLWALPKSGGAPKELAKGSASAEEKSVLAVDATSVYFATEKDVISVPKAGGAAKTLASRKSRVTGLAVDGADVLVLDGEELARIPIAGGAPTKIAQTSNSMLLAQDATHAYWCEGMMDVDLVRRAKR